MYNRINTLGIDLSHPSITKAVMDEFPFVLNFTVIFINEKLQRYYNINEVAEILADPELFNEIFYGQTITPGINFSVFSDPQLMIELMNKLHYHSLADLQNSVFNEFIDSIVKVGRAYEFSAENVLYEMSRENMYQVCRKYMKFIDEIYRNLNNNYAYVRELVINQYNKIGNLLHVTEVLDNVDFPNYTYDNGNTKIYQTKYATTFYFMNGIK